MTRCSLHSGEVTHYESVVRKNSIHYPGVRYSIHRMSFGRRSELLRQIREIGRKAEYLEAGRIPQTGLRRVSRAARSTPCTCGGG